MTTLFDIFGYLVVVLHGLDLVAQTLLIGSVAFVVFFAAGALPATQSARVVRWAAAATVATTAAVTSLNALVLASSLGLSWWEVSGSGFVIAGLAKTAAAAAIGIAAARNPRSVAWGRIGVAAVIVVLCASVATSHAAARLAGAAPLMIATGAHELGAAIWLGGLPCLWLALGREASTATAVAVGRRYATLAITGVALISGGAIAFAVAYMGSLAAAYGTAYGVMASTKSVLFAGLLLLGLANFLTLRRIAPLASSIDRVRRFVVVEMGFGFSILMAAASITSLPPGVDLVDGRATLSEIAARMAPARPRLESPDHASLALSLLQAKLDAQARAAEAQARPQAYVPGSGKAPPRNASDIAWSEYNHHWAGLIVVAIGLAALAYRSGRVPWMRHWPLLFLLLAVFLAVRSDPEVWPMGDVGLLESLKDPEVAQHRIFVALVVAFALFEWGVSTGRIASRALVRVFPVLTVVAGTLLLTHSHTLGNVKEELLIEYSHMPIAVLGIAAGWSRWLEVEAPQAEGRWAGWVWPACFVAIGVMLLFYREA